MIGNNNNNEHLGLPTPPPSNGSSQSLTKITSLTTPSPLANTIGSKPTLLSVAPMRFLIMDAPRQSNLHLYIRECSRHGVTDIVRVCEPTYDGEVDLRNAGIELHEMAYDDGKYPPKEVLERWLDLVHSRFFGKKPKDGASKSSTSDSTQSTRKTPNTALSPAVTPVNSSPTIAVHCVAGLGRAPVLVAIALVEFAGYDPVDAVALIRSLRRGAINEKQLTYLEKYKKCYKGGGGQSGCACVIM